MSTGHWGHALRRRITPLAVVLTLLTGAVQVVTASSALAAGEKAVVRMPFDGKWANASSQPSVHGPWTGGTKWALDVYAYNTSVKANVTPIGGSLSMKVTEVSNNCNLNSGADAGKAGKRVRLEVKVAGVSVGYVSYEHLDSVQVSVDDNVNSNDTLGTIKDWDWRADCWEVETDDGVHTHMSFRGNTCYVGHALNEELNQDHALGVLGSSNTGSKEKCDSIPTSNPPSVDPAPNWSGNYVASWGENRLDVFARATNNELIHAYYDANGWHDWYGLGGCISGAPGVASWGPNRIDVFAQGCGDNGNTINHKWFNGSWQPWYTLSNGQQLGSSPSAVSWGPNRIDVFARRYSDGQLMHMFYDLNGWHSWSLMGGCITGAPGVSSWGPNRLDVFAMGCGDDGVGMNHKWFNGSWQAWETLPDSAQFTSSPAAVSWDEGRIDLFARGVSGNLLHRYFNSAGWQSWESLGGNLAS